MAPESTVLIADLKSNAFSTNVLGIFFMIDVIDERV